MEVAHESTPAAGTAPLITFDRIGKRFANGTVALAGMSLTIGAREFVSFLGPSGCGKSTALRIVAGLIEPTEGRLDWDRAAGATSGGAPLHEIGFVFQEPTLMPWATVHDNVWLPLKLKGIGRGAARARIEQALAMVGLSEFAGVYPRELSGGMKMRVSIARALIAQPRVLLMDEPFAALDEIARLKLNDDVLQLWRDGRFTAVFVTHSVYESVYLSQRIVVMAARPGRVVDAIEIDAPYPRDESFRTSARYNALCVRVSAALRNAMAGAGIDH